MDPITRMVAAGAAGASGSSATYVDDVFSTFLYEGNASGQGANAQSISNGIDLSGEGGLVWIKNRELGGSNAWSHYWFDTERGATKYIRSNENDQEQTINNSLSAFNSDGFTLGETSGTNNNGSDYASWTFRKTPGFFDVVTYTGNGVQGRTISHNLGSTPGMIIVKRTDSSRYWAVYHRSLGATKYLRLNETNAESTSNQIWSNTEPTSSVFTVHDDATVNISGASYVAYLFAHDDQSFGTNSDEAIIKCGSYTGDGSSSGNVIDLGFEPQWLMIKRTSNTDSWLIWDTMRGMANGVQDPYLEPNTSDAEDTFAGVNVLPTGFELASSTGFQNSSGENYIYMAIRRPHKPPEAATDVFAVDTKTAASGSTPQYTSNFPVDFAIRRNNINSQDSPEFVTRLTNALQYTNSTNAEVSGGATFSDYFAYNNGWANATNADSNDYLWMFKRAPGFMDVVAYNGTGTARLIPHNLGAVPQMIIVKRRDSTPHWQHWYYSLGAGGLIQSAGTTPGGAYSDVQHWNHTLPTATHFSVGQDNDVNYTYPSWWTDPPATYIAYLFGSLNGISKVGSYSGTGSDVDVDCGFSNGARFVMIKRSDGSGDFYIWDSLRGITSGNDPYFLFNSNAAQVTNTNYINPLSSGFTVTSSAPAELNTSGGTYVFLAIA